MPDRIVAQEILRRFRDAGDHVYSPGTLKDRMHYLLESASQLLRCDRCAVLLLDGDAYVPRFGFGYAASDIDRLGAFRLPVDAPTVVAARENNGTFTVNAAASDPLMRHWAASVPFESIAIATIEEPGGSPLAVLTADLRTSGATFDELAVEVLAGAGVLARGVLLSERMRVQRERARDERRLMMDRVVDAENRERRRIGTDLHDVVLQRVASLAHFLEIAADQEPAGSPKRTSLQRLQLEAQESAIELRRLVSDLAPLGSETLSLRSVLEGLVASVRSEAGPLVTLHVGNDGDPSESVKAALHRITRQAIDNALSHASANTIEVRYDVGDSGTSLEISDDGVGFDQTSAVPGVGLFSMTQRAEHFGGNCQVTSSPGGGTSVTTWVPHASG